MFKQKGTLILIAAAVVLAAGLFYLGYWSQLKSKSQPEPIIEEPEMIFSLTGLIQELGENYLTIEALPEKNFGLAQAKQVKIEFVPAEVELARLSFIMSANQEDNGGEIESPVLRREQIAVQDLAVGQEVVAVSMDNIKDQDTFLAYKIDVIVLQ